jgi:hypothetical protein
MHEHFVVFFEPCVHLVPVKGDVILQVLALRLQVAPGGFFGDPLANSQVVERGLTLALVLVRISRRGEQIEFHVVHREVINRQSLLLDHQQDRAAVGDGLAAKHHAHAPLRRLDVDIAGQRPLVVDSCEYSIFESLCHHASSLWTQEPRIGHIHSMIAG